MSQQTSKAITLPDAAAHPLLADPATGKQPCRKSVWQWVVKGFNPGKGKPRIFLGADHTVHGLRTNETYIREFVQELGRVPASLPAEGSATHRGMLNAKTDKAMNELDLICGGVTAH